MKRKLIAVIISFLLFVLSVPQSCFAELGACLQKENTANGISLPVVNAINMLDISKEIAKTHFKIAKDFFECACIVSVCDSKKPVYNSRNDGIMISLVQAVISGQKKELVFIRDYEGLYEFFDRRMQGTGPPDGIEITKHYLLFIEALQKGSVPASFIAIANIDV